MPRTWSKQRPKLTSDRRRVYERCGARCFLRPSDLGYPICTKATRICKPTCDGLRAAYSRARQQHSYRIASVARKKAKRLRCKWVG